MTEIERRLHERVDNTPFMKDNRLSILRAELGRVQVSAPIRPQLRNNYGIVHGGFYMSMADTTAGLAALTDGRKYVTQNASLQFLGNVSDGTLYAEGTVLHAGRTVCSVRVEIRSEDGKLLCEGLFSMFAVEMPFVPIGPNGVAGHK